MKSTSQSNPRRRLPSRAINIGASGRNAQDHLEGGGNLPPHKPLLAPSRLQHRSALTAHSPGPRTLEKARGSEREQAKRGKEQGTRLPRGRHPSDASGEETEDKYAAGGGGGGGCSQKERVPSPPEVIMGGAGAQVSARRAPNTALPVLPGSVRPSIPRRDSGWLSLLLSVRKEQTVSKWGAAGALGTPDLAATLHAPHVRQPSPADLAPPPQRDPRRAGQRGPYRR